MKLLLDTQVMLWWLGQDPRLGKKALAEIALPSNKIYVSPLSIFELAAKERINKIKISTDKIVEQLELERFEELPYDFWSAKKMAKVPLREWRDPFDFGIIAQAAAKKLTLLTADHNILNMNWSELKVLDATK